MTLQRPRTILVVANCPIFFKVSNLMTLTLPLSAEEQATLEEKARAQGLSLDAFVRAVLVQGGGADAVPNEPKKTLTLPVWPGRVIGALRREDIYNDVR